MPACSRAFPSSRRLPSRSAPPSQPTIPRCRGRDRRESAHVQHLRRLADRQTELVENFLTDERARMRRGRPYSGGCAAHQ
jgi:hypothetical protein